MSHTIHESSYVETDDIGDDTEIWYFCHVMPGASIGSGCRIGQNVFIDRDVRVGNGVKIQNNVSVYRGVTIEDDVFLGPSCVFTNVRNPRSARPVDPEQYDKTLIQRGVTIGANATIVCGVTIGRHAFVAAGAVVTHDVPAHHMVMGVPARIGSCVCFCGRPIKHTIQPKKIKCKHCGADPSTFDLTS